MKIAVIHRSLALLGGGERVRMSLLRALDRTRHDTVLRCIDPPPPGVRFAGGNGGDAAGASVPAAGGEAEGGWGGGRQRGR